MNYEVTVQGIQKYLFALFGKEFSFVDADSLEGEANVRGYGFDVSKNCFIGLDGDIMPMGLFFDVAAEAFN